LGDDLTRASGQYQEAGSGLLPADEA